MNDEGGATNGMSLFYNNNNNNNQGKLLYTKTILCSQHVAMTKTKCWKIS